MGGGLWVVAVGGRVRWRKSHTFVFGGALCFVNFEEFEAKGAGHLAFIHTSSVGRCVKRIRRQKSASGWKLLVEERCDRKLSAGIAIERPFTALWPADTTHPDTAKFHKDDHAGYLGIADGQRSITASSAVKCEQCLTQTASKVFGRYSSGLLFGPYHRAEVRVATQPTRCSHLFRDALIRVLSRRWNSTNSLGNRPR
jgi:hypothetical protein